MTHAGWEEEEEEEEEGGGCPGEPVFK